MLDIEDEARKEVVKENISSTLHRALHSHVCEYAFDDIEWVSYKSIKPAAKKKRTDGIETSHFLDSSGGGECSSSLSSNDGGTPDDGTSDSGTSNGGISDGGTSDGGTSDGGASDKNEGTSDETGGTSNGGVISTSAETNEVTTEVVKETEVFETDATTAAEANGDSITKPEEMDVSETNGATAEKASGDAIATVNTQRAEEDISGGKRKISEDEEEERCLICLEEYEDEEEIKQLDCEHRFHPECLELWFRDQATCPCCRACAACSPPNIVRIIFPDTADNYNWF